ncbi:serine hydrolase domain-containing protein [Noviluteimonas gilva]|uniref:Serine hydrolase n=1 Tax=Noviluteimonas gilva TaxID=2682097 RepID=A0A7C9HWH3_9GAMM|nr:serine hydrolase domain-containing protein [Lysobacter gilvus]MUV15218.1 serine hydrolase [Lysobacter gilvus]
MKRVLASSLCLLAFGAQAQSSSWQRTVDDTVARYKLPGIAVGVVEDGKVVYATTRGETLAGSGQKLTSKSLFKIASNSKAMTASVLARLVDQGKLRWDDPVTKHLPQFAMFDPWVTKNMQVRDLLVHNSGLPEGGGDLMLWPEPNTFTRGDIIAGLKYIKPAYSFRSGYAYDNLLYVVAGEVAAAAGGAPYETLVQREVFDPLGMTRCKVGAFDRDAVGDVAQPHTRGENMQYKPGDNVDGTQVPAITSAAAGGIRCSLDDMLRWMQAWLAPDAQAKAWLSDAQRKEMWKARTPMPISGRRVKWDHTHALAYAYGFRLADVDGRWTVSHTGTLSGMYSAMVLLPDQRSGFVFMINADADDTRTVLSEVLTKQFTKPDADTTIAPYADEIEAEWKQAEADAKPHTKPDGKREVLAAPFDPKRTGTWRDPWFGTVRLCPVNGRLQWASEKSPLMTGHVVTVDGQWRIDWDEDRMDLEAWVDFESGHMRMRKVDPEGDFSSDFEDLDFTRTGDCSP